VQPPSTAQANANSIAEGAAATPPPAAVETALERARNNLTSLQDPAGWWQGELETNVTMDAEDLLLRESRASRRRVMGRPCSSSRRARSAI
jgi:squalene-hopene/tetraprenyl-beta-curcumene cyclase